MCRTYRIIPWHHRSLCCKQRSPLWGEQGTEWQREVLRECRGAVFVKATGFAVCACDSNTDTRRIDGCLLQLFSWGGKWHVYIRWPASSRGWGTGSYCPDVHARYRGPGGPVAAYLEQIL